jgi:hypothetical protein
MLKDMATVERLRQHVKDLKEKIDAVHYQSAVVECLEGLTDEQLNEITTIKKEIKDTKEKIQTILYA